VQEAKETYKNLGIQKPGYDFLDNIFTILNRENKLKEIGI
jgi:hypothetical protein